jgi:hypothetical protein
MTEMTPQSPIANLQSPLIKSRPLDYWLLWLVALASLAANLWLITTLLGVRRQAGQGALTAARAVGDLRQSSIDYQVHVQQFVPIVLSVPISQTVKVPINTTLAIDTEATIPLETPIGTFPITIPIRAAVPVALQPEVPLRLTVPVSTTVPVELDVPIHLAIADTALGESLGRAQQSLTSLASQLGASTSESSPP